LGKLTAELSALDQTVRIYDENIDPVLIDPVNGWQGRYGIDAARRIQQQDTRSARWIAADALRELNSEAVQARLRSRRGTPA